jgi:hypothetical protein
MRSALSKTEVVRLAFSADSAGSAGSARGVNWGQVKYEGANWGRVKYVRSLPEPLTPLLERIEDVFDLYSLMSRNTLQYNGQQSLFYCFVERNCEALEPGG